MPESLEKLEDVKADVEGNPKLAADVEVVKIHEKGPDWILRDFDANSVELKAGPAEAQAARARALAELESLLKEGKLTAMLKDLLKKLKKEPPSANLHWSPARERSSSSTYSRERAMRDFADYQRELGLLRFSEGPAGTLHCVPVAPGAPRLLFRHFDRELPPALVPAFATLTAAAGAWLAADDELAALVRVEPLSEIGTDVVARRHFNATSLAAFLATDPDDDPPEPPDELMPMQARFRARPATSPREELVRDVLERAILSPSAKTFYLYDEERFAVAELSPTRAELERWAQLTRS